METLLINVCFCRQVMEARAATTQAETLAASEKATADTLREERVRCRCTWQRNREDIGALACHCLAIFC